MTTVAGSMRRPLCRVSTVALAAVLSLDTAAARADVIEIGAGADPCAGQACRELTPDEKAVFGRTLSRLMGLLPTPDPARYEQTGLKSLQGLAPFLVTDAVWQSAAFPSNVVDAVGVRTADGVFPRSLGLVYSYALKGEAERSRLGLSEQSFHTTSTGEMEIFDLRVQVTASAMPLSPPSIDEGAGVLEVSRDVLVVEFRDTEPEQQGRGMARTALLLGARTDPVAASAARRGATPAAAGSVAPVRAVRIDLHGPRSDVKSLLRKLDRKAFKAMLAPVPAAQGPARRAPRK